MAFWRERRSHSFISGAQASSATGVKNVEPYLLAALGLAVPGGTGFPGVWLSRAAPLTPSLPVLQVTCLSLKVFFFCWLFVWVRWTLPRFRYDQFMRMGWKLMLPLAMLNLLVTGIFILMQKG